MGVEIERKFLVRDMPDLSKYPVRLIEQAYLNYSPTIRIRHDQSDTAEKYELTYKGSGIYAHQEDNLPIDAATYQHLLEKHDGSIIRKKRYMIPVGKYTAELDVFEGDLSGLVFLEVEFPTEEEERRFIAPSWFGEDVTSTGLYSNARLAKSGLPYKNV